MCFPEVSVHLTAIEVSGDLGTKVLLKVPLDVALATQIFLQSGIK